MKILTAEDTRKADAYTIKHEPIQSIDLMERASEKCFKWLIDQFDDTDSYSIFCGVGNNGGDGLAIARMLLSKGFSVEVFIVAFSENSSKDFNCNLQRLIEIGVKPVALTKEQYQFEIKGTVIIDAIFGSGLTRPIDGYIAEIVQRINNYKQNTISIDVPSGLFSDSNIGNNYNTIVRANYTLTFQQPKLSMLFPENYPYVGDFKVLDIGLSNSFHEQAQTPYYYTSSEIIITELKARLKYEHKGNYGHALLIVGSTGKMGAGILASEACLRTGVGLLTLQIPKNALDIMQTSVPEAMCIVDSNENVISDVLDVSTYSTIGIGPGIGKDGLTHKVLKSLIQNATTPIVIDADALNILSENKTWLSFLPNNSILTPHPKEFERLVGKWNNDEERLQKQQELSVKNTIITVLKGANTSICLPNGDVYFNSTGNPGMATGGSGDVLTGIITSLLTQGYVPDKAAIIGVFIHGLAGDIAITETSENSLIASDIINNISSVYQFLKS